MTDHYAALARAILFAGSAITTVAVCGLGVSKARGHSWYPPECCSDKDCEPVAGEVDEGPAGYTLPDGRLVPYGAPVIKASPDAKFHWCRNLYSKALICLFVPARGT